MFFNVDKQVAYSIILFILFPFIIWCFSPQDGVILWLYCWIPVFLFAITGRNVDLFSRGFVLIAWTVLIVTVGYEQLLDKYPAQETKIKMLSAMITMIAGGVGGNFMAHDIIRSEEKPKKKNKAR